jgi:hypothetical protein
MPYKAILKHEYQAFQNNNEFIINTDTAFGAKTEFLEGVFSNQKNSLSRDVEEELSQMPSIAKLWELQRGDEMSSYNSINKELKILNAKRYLSSCLGVKAEFDDLRKLPALCLTTYIQFMKVHNTRQSIVINDVMDFMISSIVPYIDAVITEKQMGNFYKQAKSFIPKMNSLEIYSLKDLRITD